MADWPTGLLTQPGGTIGLSSRSSLVNEFLTSGNFLATGAVWPAANRAIYIPFIVENTVTAFKMAFEVTTQSGNCDVGLYDEMGNRIVSSGSTAVAAAGLQTIDITDTTLTPALYYMAMCVDNITAAFTRSLHTAIWQQVIGVQQQAVGAVTLPDPATFANPASNYLPSLTIALKSTI